ncbi:hypothetical protein CHLNCDRAFT_19445, partial [Chlorella variabilis]
AAAPPAWTYAEGGSDWPGVCADGSHQSPIGIVTGSELAPALPPEARASLNFGVALGLRIFNTGRTVQVEWDDLDGSNASVPILGTGWASIYDPAALYSTPTGPPPKLFQIPFKPFQIHWHSACEHVMDGDACPLELHIVTAVDNSTGAEVPEPCNAAPCLAVFGVLLKYNPDVYAPGAPYLDTILSNVPDTVGAAAATHLPGATLDLSSLLPEDLTYVAYNGSLTTPPCSESVAWHVFVTPKAELSASQVQGLQAILGTTVEEAPAACVVNGGAPHSQLTCRIPSGARINNRVLQPVGDRELFVSM